mmetsp:Transcript_9725/g.22057  ORF Transcript_9725/g.22057 Transcript_9725/m.22057 type:complete len:242 (+) Transcript_9725:976-1701(+)
MEDYSCPLLPNATHRVLIGHTAGVKCVSWVGNELLASGGNDGCLRLWDVATGTCTGYFEGHTGRVWDVSASASGTRIASACADGAVRIWSLDENNGRATTLRYTVPTATLAEHRGDVYSVCIHPSEHAVVTAGYDRTVRLFDVNKAVLLRTLQGHELAVRQVYRGPGVEDTLTSAASTIRPLEGILSHPGAPIPPHRLSSIRRAICWCLAAKTLLYGSGMRVRGYASNGWRIIWAKSQASS